MRSIEAFPYIALLGSFTLAACSAGGNGIASTPPPTPAPTPMPTNTTITNLQANQAFAGDGGTGTTSIDLATRTIASGSTTPATIQVSYDAPSRSYTVTAAGRSQTFSPGDIQTGTATGETRYSKTGPAGNDYLTLVTTPYSGSTSNRYVGLGYWQRNLSNATTQNTTLDVFTYGLDTPAAGVPRTGTAKFTTDNFGFVTIPGKAPLAFTGSGSFNVDLALGTFATSAYVNEYELTSPRSQSGGSIALTAGGHLGSGNSFTGNMSYTDTYTSMSGTIAGRFFGPNAEEIGASFSGSDRAGAAVTGAFTGQASNSAPAVNLSITNYVTDQLFYTQQGMLSIAPSPSGGKAVNYRTLIGQVQRRLDGSILFSPGESDFAAATFTNSDLVTGGPANYTSYRKTVNGVTTTLSLFQPGATNTELALTYAGFGSWAGGASPGYDSFDGRVFFTYGITTPTYLLAGKTGTASYSGVVHGVGALRDGSVYDVGGTSHFGVDFGAQTFNGSLQMTASQASGGSSRDLGNWTFADHLSAGQLVGTGLVAPANSSGAPGTITPQFYGPDGEEIGGVFSLQTGADSAADTMRVVGATVAKRP